MVAATRVRRQPEAAINALARKRDISEAFGAFVARRDFSPNVDYVLAMKLLAAICLGLVAACSGGSSTSSQPKKPDVDPAVAMEQKRAATCKALCATMGKCGGDADFDASACATACGQAQLSLAHLESYDTCAAATDCKAATKCIAKVRLDIRQETTCKKVCERSTTCSVEDARKNLPPEKFEAVRKQQYTSENTRQCVAECAGTALSFRQIRHFDSCLAKPSCAEYTPCLGK